MGCGLLGRWVRGHGCGVWLVRKVGQRMRVWGVAC